MSARWSGYRHPRDLGLPTDDLGGRILVVSGDGQSTGVQVWVHRDGATWGRVLLCRPGGSNYVLIGEPTVVESDTDLVSSDGPWMYYLRRDGIETPSGWGFNAQAIVRVNVVTGEDLKFGVRELGAGEWTVSGLHGTSCAGEVVYATCASLEPTNVEYVIAAIRVEDATVRPLRRLEAVFA